MNTYEYQGFHIPNRMMNALQRYIQQRKQPGGFLGAVLENDLIEACGHADEENLRNLPAYAAYLYNEAPSQCFGSREKVKAWLTGGAT